MTRIVKKLALGLSITTLGLIGVGNALAHNGDSELHRLDTRCYSTAIHTTAASTQPGSYYRIHLMKAFPPNWVSLNVATGWQRTDDFNSVFRNPIGMPIQRNSWLGFTNLEPGRYFVWALFATPNGQGGFNYHWVASGACDIAGNVMGIGARKAKKAKRIAVPRKAKPKLRIAAPTLP